MAYLHKRSSSVGAIPNLGDIKVGELAINMADGVIHTRDSGAIIQVGLKKSGDDTKDGNLDINGILSTANEKNIISGKNLYTKPGSGILYSDKLRARTTNAPINIEDDVNIFGDLNITGTLGGLTSLTLDSLSLNIIDVKTEIKNTDVGEPVLINDSLRVNNNTTTGGVITYDNAVPISNDYDLITKKYYEDNFIAADFYEVYYAQDGSDLSEIINASKDGKSYYVVINPTYSVTWSGGNGSSNQIPLPKLKNQNIKIVSDYNTNPETPPPFAVNRDKDANTKASLTFKTVHYSYSWAIFNGNPSSFSRAEAKYHNGIMLESTNISFLNIDIIIESDTNKDGHKSNNSTFGIFGDSNILFVYSDIRTNIASGKQYHGFISSYNMGKINLFLHRSTLHGPIAGSVGPGGAKTHGFKNGKGTANKFNFVLPGCDSTGTSCAIDIEGSVYIKKSDTGISSDWDIARYSEKEILSGTSFPSSSLGKDGDIYIGY